MYEIVSKVRKNIKGCKMNNRFIIFYRQFWLKICVIIIFQSATIVAQTPTTEWWEFMREIENEHYLCYQAKEAIEIDGKIDESTWKKAPWTKYFVDLGPGNLEAHNKPAPVPHLKTRVKMLWDDYYFYIAAELEEPHVWGTLLFHDQIICLENNFEIFIDANGDNHNYIEIEINALNTVWDLVVDKPYRDKAKPDQAWNITGLKKAVYVKGTLNNPKDIDNEWTMEMAIPWESIAEYTDSPCPPQNGNQWRINFARTEFENEIIQSKFTTQDVTNNAYQKKENGEVGIWSWSSHGVRNLHTPEMFGIVQFTNLAAGDAEWIPDQTVEARKILMDIYYAQRDYYKTYEKYVINLEELGLTKKKTENIILELTKNGYSASITVKVKSGIQKLTIREDSKIIVD